MPISPEMRNWVVPKKGELPENYLDLFSSLEKEHDLPPGLLDSVMQVESGGRPGQTSKAGAKGYFQFTEPTAKAYNVKVNDLHSEAKGAAKMFADLLKWSKKDLSKALAGYNWGMGNVAKFGLDKMPKETREYLPKVVARMKEKSNKAREKEKSVPSEEELSKMSSNDLTIMREKLKESPIEQERLAPFHHRAVAREATAESPIIGAGLAVFLPIYQALKTDTAKSIGIDVSESPDFPATPPSTKQMIEGYKGIGEGLMQYFAAPNENSPSKTSLEAKK